MFCSDQDNPLIIVETQRNLFSTTSLNLNFNFLKNFATNIIDERHMSFIQLHPMFCAFDGYSEEDFKEYGFTPLYIEIPQRQVKEVYNDKKFNPYGIRGLGGRYITLQRIEHYCFMVNYTIKDMFINIIEDPFFTALFKDGRSNSISKCFKSPLYIRKIILSAPNLQGGYDIYHWFKTNRMKDATKKKREVKTILTHVNGISISKIFNDIKHKALKDRIIQTTSGISIDRTCKMQFDNVHIDQEASCGLE